MCMICVEFEKERMTIKEARRALGEMAEGMEKEHVEEVQEKLEEAEEKKAASQDDD